MSNKKCIFVIGPESSGSKLIAKVIANVLDIKTYGQWSGSGTKDNGYHKVVHRSLPYNFPPQFPSVEDLIKQNQMFDIYFILTTRDISISERSRFERWTKPLETAKKESDQAREIMSYIINSNQKYLIWSYETFMFLKSDYLKCLYSFLEIESDFIPSLFDGNKGKVKTLGYIDLIKQRLFPFYSVKSQTTKIFS